nr:MAG TPA: hypothetical protein [Caudoviricetes sp.]
MLMAYRLRLLISGNAMVRTLLMLLAIPTC